MINSLSQCWNKIQRVLFPFLEDELGPLSEKQRTLATVIEMARFEDFVLGNKKATGRPQKERASIARAFAAKAVYNLSTTRMLLDRLDSDRVLRQICGWERRSAVPDESCFSRAFAEFAKSGLLEKIHEMVIYNYRADRLVGHVSRDATEIKAREKAIKKEAVEQSKPKRGRPKKKKKTEKQATRISRQANMSLSEMLEDLPKACDIGSKKNSQGYIETWKGYKFHIDVADGQIPLSAILTSASVHDSQVALPLMAMTSKRVDYLYDVMDSAYDSVDIKLRSLLDGHMPLIDSNRRRGEKIPFLPHQAQRYKERTTVERVNGRLKDEFGGRTVRVRGHSKVMTHLMFGLLALTIDQLIRYAT